MRAEWRVACGPSGVWRAREETRLRPLEDAQGTLQASKALAAVAFSGLEEGGGGASGCMTAPMRERRSDERRARTGMEGASGLSASVEVSHPLYSPAARTKDCASDHNVAATVTIT